VLADPLGHRQPHVHPVHRQRHGHIVATAPPAPAERSPPRVRPPRPPPERSRARPSACSRLWLARCSHHRTARSYPFTVGTDGHRHSLACAIAPTAALLP
jgi:hypothetical protein